MASPARYQWRVRSRLERLTLAIVPPGLPSAELMRARFFVGAHLAAMPMMVFCVPAYG